MNELSLFSGVGGGLLATKWLLGWRCIGYVEWNEYCCKVIEQRIKDGYLDEAPVYQMDIRIFNETIAPMYRGVVDVITAGFPCQPFSVAGRRKGSKAKENEWPATIRCIHLVRPQYVFLENVPGILAHEYIRQIFGDLVESGYYCQWRCLSAAEVGAPHIRDRIWIMAYSPRPRTRLEKYRSCRQRGQSANSLESEILSQGNRKVGTKRITPSLENVSNTQQIRCQSDQGMANGEYVGQKQERSHTSSVNWWFTEPKVGRVAYGLPNQLDRLKALGEGQIPKVVEIVWKLFIEEIKIKEAHYEIK